MSSVSPAAAPSHRCDDHSHHHHHGHNPSHGWRDAHSHHHGAQQPTPQHFLELNPCDAAHFSEVCACCQGAVDVDELVGLKAAAPHDSVTAAHSHGHWRPRLPTGAAGWTMAAATTWATVPGLVFGWQNFRAAAANGVALDRTLTQLRGVDLQEPAGLSAEAKRQQELNRAAYVVTLTQSRSMQRFIAVFAGMLPLLGSIAMLGSVLVPLLGAVGSGFLLIYCLSHIGRYMTYEWPRVHALRGQLQQARGKLSPQAADITRGLDASTQLLAARTRLYPTVAAAFGVYAVGAAMLSASVLVAAAVLVPLGAAALAAGLSAVLYLNNGPIKGAFGKNQDRDINRRTLGSQRDILQRIARLDQEAAQLQQLRQSMRTAKRKAGTARQLLGLRLLRGVTLGLSYGLTFGLASLGRNQALARLREAQVAALQNPGALLRPLAALPSGQPTSSLTPSAELWRLLHERPEQVAHQRGALLDHFHARVAAEGLDLAGA